MRKNKALYAVAALALLTAVVLGGCTQATPSGEWKSPNANLDNTRYVGGRIDSSTIQNMGVAWTADLNTTSAFGAVAATPLIVGGAVIIQDLKGNVYSYNVETGKLNWKRTYNEETVGPNGVTWDDGTIYGATKSTAFALDADTGQEQWATKGLASAKGAGFTIAPQVYDGMVQIATAAQPGGGIMYALDADTGKKLWSWDSVKGGKDQIADGEPIVEGGAWAAPLVWDGGVFWGTGNPYQTINQGVKTPAEGLYNSSTVRLNQKTGRLEWYNQIVPNDFYDWDQHLSPIKTIGEDDEPVLITGGKHGNVIAMNPESGETIWKTAVGTHNGHDNDPKDALEGNFEPEAPLEVAPGTLGGVETAMAVADGTAYAATVNLPATYKDFDDSDPFKVLPDYSTGTGELTALDVESGDVKWEKKLGSMPFGAATVANDIVFTTTFDGMIYGFDADSGDEVWSSKLPAGTNSPIAISDDTIIVAAGIKTGKGQKTQLVAFKIGGLGQIGGAEAPEVQDQAEEQRAEETEVGSGEAGATTIDAKALFTQNCGGCHTLADAGTSGTVGPNLDQAKPSQAVALEKITNGGGGMPAFKDTLSEEEIEALAEYVSSVAGQ